MLHEREAALKRKVIVHAQGMGNYRGVVITLSEANFMLGDKQLQGFDKPVLFRLKGNFCAPV